MFLSHRGINIEHRNQYYPEGQQKSGDQLMSGPKYPGVTESHKYGPVPPRPPQAGEMTGPVHLADGKNQFSKVDERVAGQVTSMSSSFSELDTNFKVLYIFSESVNYTFFRKSELYQLRKKYHLPHLESDF